jgi:hypothetical protein
MGSLGTGTDARLSNGCRDDEGGSVRLLTGTGSREEVCSRLLGS